MPGYGEGAFKGRVGEVGQLTADARLQGDGVVAHGVLRDDGGQLVAVRPAQGGGGVGKVHRGCRGHAVVRVGSDGFEHVRPALVMVVEVTVAVVGRRGLNQVGAEPHQLAHRVGDAEHGDQLSERRVVGHDVVQRAALAHLRVDDVDEVAQRDIGITDMLKRVKQQAAACRIESAGGELAEQ